eukprot:gene12078-biopygen11140
MPGRPGGAISAKVESADLLGGLLRRSRCAAVRGAVRGADGADAGPYAGMGRDWVRPVREVTCPPRRQQAPRRPPRRPPAAAGPRGRLGQGLGRDEPLTSRECGTGTQPRPGQASEAGWGHPTPGSAVAWGPNYAPGKPAWLAGRRGGVFPSRGAGEQGRGVVGSARPGGGSGIGRVALCVACLLVAGVPAPEWNSRRFPDGAGADPRGPRRGRGGVRLSGPCCTQSTHTAPPAGSVGELGDLEKSFFLEMNSYPVTNPRGNVHVSALQICPGALDLRKFPPIWYPVKIPYGDF